MHQMSPDQRKIKKCKLAKERKTNKGKIRKKENKECENRNKCTARNTREKGEKECS